MQNFIVAVMTVLGTVLVLAGVAVIVARAAASPGGDPVEGLPPSVEAGADKPVTATTGVRRAARLLRMMRRVYPSDRLIGWGVVLLLIAASASGMIGVTLSVSTSR